MSLSFSAAMGKDDAPDPSTSLRSAQDDNLKMRRRRQEAPFPVILSLSKDQTYAGSAKDGKCQRGMSLSFSAAMGKDDAPDPSTSLRSAQDDNLKMTRRRAPRCGALIPSPPLDNPAARRYNFVSTYAQSPGQSPSCRQTRL
jgi:hypothetical protein